jgi:hypothetical protein
VTLWQGQTADVEDWHVEATSAFYGTGDLCEGASHLLWWAAPP